MKFAMNTLVCAALVTGIVVVNAKAADKMPDPQTLLKKSVSAIYTPNEESVYVMKLTDSGGSVSVRDFALSAAASDTFAGWVAGMKKRFRQKDDAAAKIAPPPSKAA